MTSYTIFEPLTCFGFARLIGTNGRRGKLLLKNFTQLPHAVAEQVIQAPIEKSVFHHKMQQHIIPDYSSTPNILSSPEMEFENRGKNETIILDGSYFLFSIPPTTKKIH